MLRSRTQSACAITAAEEAKWTTKRGQPPRKTNKRKHAQQTVLDLGQKRQRVCAICGVLYVAGNKLDEAKHRSICDAWLHGVKFTKWCHQSVLLDLDWLAIVSVGRMTAVLRNVCAAMARDLGGEIDDDEKCLRAYLAVSKRRVVGCALVEPLREASRPDGCSAFVHVGIRKIWVHAEWRRKRIASKLLDTIRDTFIFDHKIPRDRVACTRPTRLGRAFFATYLGEHNPLKVY